MLLNATKVTKTSVSIYLRNDIAKDKGVIIVTPRNYIFTFMCDAKDFLSIVIRISKTMLDSSLMLV